MFHIPVLRGARFGLAGLLTAGLLVAASAAHAGERSSSWFSIGGNAVKGSGQLQTEARPVGAFEAVSVRGALKVVLRQSGSPAVQVRADDNLLPLIETRVESRSGVPTLEIGVKSGTHYSARSEPVVTVDVATLKALSISGSGDVECDALKAPRLRVAVAGSGDARLRGLAIDEMSVRVSGSGDVQAAGRAAKLGVSIAGSGDVSALELAADEVEVSIAGSGDARVNAGKTLAVSIAGSGDVAYQGDATVKTSIAGSGTVRKR
jgi:hypothetical protein